MEKTLKKEQVVSAFIPFPFLKWLVSERMRFLNEMTAGKRMRYFSAHLPVMATWREGEEFPVNLTVKGIGLIPREDCIMDYIDLFESTLARARIMPWKESLPMRIKAMERLYSDIENFDPGLLGGLEIFDGNAMRNMRENKRASLLYMGVSVDHAKIDTVTPERPVAIQYISFQVNGYVEILNKDNIHYRYLLSARRLFEFERFHIYQPDYPSGYLIRIKEVKDKSPWSRVLRK